MKRAWMVLPALILGASTALAQAPAGSAATPQSLIAEVQRLYAAVGTNATGAADAFPEDKYTWQPTPDIRTWAQLVAHMTDDAYNNCAVISGMTAAPPSVERGQPPPNSKSKAELVAGFKAAVDTCNKAFAALTPANMLDPAGGRGNASKLGQLITITSHANEHYGNMVTYMRLQNLVPPSTANAPPRGGGGRGAAPAGGRGGF
jgi:hypothetical protein